MLRNDARDARHELLEVLRIRAAFEPAGEPGLASLDTHGRGARGLEPENAPYDVLMDLALDLVVGAGECADELVERGYAARLDIRLCRPSPTSAVRHQLTAVRVVGV